MKLTAIIALIFSLIVGLSTLVLPQDERSELEGRYLEKFTQVSPNRTITGLAMDEVETAFNDQLTLRNSIFGLNSIILDSLQINYRNGVFIGKDSFLFNGIAYEPKSMEELDITADEMFNNIVRLKESTPDDSLFIFTNIFRKGLVYDEKLPSNYLTSGFNTKVTGDMINEKVVNSGLEIEMVDGTQSLINHKDEYVYFYTDHHYTGLGAYYVYQDILTSINENTEWNLTIPHYDEFESAIVPGDFVGSQARILGNVTYSEIDYLEIALPMDMPSYTRWDNGKETNTPLVQFDDRNSYSNYMSSDHANTVVKTDNPVDYPKILIIGDSFTNAIETLTVYNASEMHSLDPRHYKGDIYEYIAEMKPDVTIVLRDTLLYNAYMNSGD